MTSPLITAGWEVLGGPYDGSVLPAYGTQLVVKQFERSPVYYLYRKAQEDTGAPYWEFCGATTAEVAA